MAKPSFRSIQLPSRGALYGTELPDGKVNIRRLQNDEFFDAFDTESGEMYETIRRVVATGTQLPEGFKDTRLLVGDQLALLVALRTFAFGGNYKFTWRCKFCPKGVTESPVDIAQDLNELPGGLVDPKDKTKRLPLAEPIDIKLDDEECVVSARFTRVEDALNAARHLERVRPSVGKDEAKRQNRRYQMALLLTAKDGAPLKVHEADALVRGLTAGDFLRIDNALTAAEAGIDLRLRRNCGECGVPNELKMPFDLEFFRPSTL